MIEIVGWLLCMYTCLLGRLLMDPKGGLNVFSLVAFPIQNWISVLNPLVTILIIDAYRKSLSSFLRHPASILKPRMSTVTAINTIKLDPNLTKIKKSSLEIWYQALGIRPQFGFLINTRWIVAEKSRKLKLFKSRIQLTNFKLTIKIVQFKHFKKISLNWFISVIKLFDIQ